MTRRRCARRRLRAHRREAGRRAARGLRAAWPCYDAIPTSAPRRSSAALPGARAVARTPRRGARDAPAVELVDRRDHPRRARAGRARGARRRCTRAGREAGRPDARRARGACATAAAERGVAGAGRVQPPLPPVVRADPRAARGRRRYGPLLHVRARYGHGGRSATSRSGAPTGRSLGRRRAARPGQPPDRPHPVCSSGDVDLAFAELRTDFWPMDVEDNAFLALRAGGGGFAWLHASLDRVEEPVLVRDRAAATAKLEMQRARRQLRRRAAHAVRDAARDGAAADDRVGVAARATRRGTPSSPTSLPRSTARRRSARRSTTPSRRSRVDRGGVPTDDHHPDAAADLARRRRHRPAVLLPRGAAAASSIAAAITKYVYIAVHRNFDDDILLKYSQVERVARRRRRQAPAPARVPARSPASSAAIEISSMADIPAGTGSARRARSRSAC